MLAAPGGCAARGPASPGIVLATVGLRQLLNPPVALLLHPPALEHDRRLVGRDAEQRRSVSPGNSGRREPTARTPQSPTIPIRTMTVCSGPSAEGSGMATRWPDLGARPGSRALRMSCACSRVAYRGRCRRPRTERFGRARHPDEDQVQVQGGLEDVGQVRRCRRIRGAPDRGQRREGHQVADAAAELLDLIRFRRLNRARPSSLPTWEAYSAGEPGPSRSRSSRRNSSGGTKKGYSCRMPPGGHGIGAEDVEHNPGAKLGAVVRQTTASSYSGR